MSAQFIVTTSDTVHGFEISEYLGVAQGLVIRVPSPSQGFQ
ncbi:MAG: hypothetical protein RIS70_2691, partial [Planctomycetota bacterium]